MRTVDSSADLLIATRVIPLTTRTGRPVAEKIAANTIADGDCLLWTGPLDSGGWGRVSIDHREYLAHRVSYTIAKGQIPAGLTLDHFVCRNRACVAPDHLEPVTSQENVRRRAKDDRHSLPQRSRVGERQTCVPTRGRTGASTCSAGVNDRPLLGHRSFPHDRC